MTTKSHILPLIFCVLGYSCPALFASPADSSRKFSLSEVFMLGGGSGQASAAGTLENFRKLCPNSPTLMQNFNDYYPYSSYNSSGNGFFTLGIGMRQKKKENGPTIRLGIMYTQGTSIIGGYFKADSYPVDTLVSAQTGKKTYIDSIVRDQYHFRHTSNHVRMELSSVWRTTPRHKMKLYGGIGISGGFSLNSQTTILRSKSSWYSSSPYSYYYGYPYQDTYYGGSVQEVVQNKMQTFAAVFCPFGLDYQLSKKKSSFWNKLNLFLEFRAQIGYTKIPEIKTSMQAYMQSGFGLRVSI